LVPLFRVRRRRTKNSRRNARNERRRNATSPNRRVRRDAFRFAIDHFVRSAEKYRGLAGFNKNKHTHVRNNASDGESGGRFVKVHLSPFSAAERLVERFSPLFSLALFRRGAALAIFASD